MNYHLLNHIYVKFCHISLHSLQAGDLKRMLLPRIRPLLYSLTSMPIVAMVLLSIHK